MIPRTRSPLPSLRGRPSTAGLAVLAVALAATLLAWKTAPASAAPPAQIATIPRDGATHVSPNVRLAIVFDQPTGKSGSFSVADLDSSSGLVPLLTPTWSALGDTVYLTPAQPLTFGHLYGMRVNLIYATDLVTAGIDLPVVTFRVIARALLEPIPAGSDFSSVTLVPGVPTAVGVNVRERNNTSATLTSARADFYAGPLPPGHYGFTVVPLRSITIPFRAVIPRLGSARLNVPVTLPPDLARQAADGIMGFGLTFEGMDEVGLPVTLQAISGTVVSPIDTVTVVAPAQVVPAMASNLTIQSIAVERPLPGAAYAAGDTVRVRAVVTGFGTGSFRVLVTMDGDAVAMENGYMESGRPVTIEPRGPMPSRRLGEHKLHVIVEWPQNVAARPITVVCMPPPSGIAPPPTPAEAETLRTVEPPRPPSAFTLDATYLALGKSEFRDEEAAGLAWSAWRAHYTISKTAELTANATWRLRMDDPQNGSGSPEQMDLKLAVKDGSVAVGDLAPSLAADAPLLASPVPRRGGEVEWRGTPLGTLQGFLALDSRPRSAAGAIDQPRSDLYAARLARGFVSGRVEAALYGGYVHDDPTAGAPDSVVRTQALYGGSGSARLGESWTLGADLVTVRHRTIEGIEPGRSRTAVKGALHGVVAGFETNADAFHMAPDMATTLNPYALSDRKGGSAGIARDIANWRFFGGFRREQPVDEGDAPTVRVDRWNFGGKLKLNQVSWVTPEFIRLQHHGAATHLRESRAATELVIGEQYEGQTRGRIDLALFEDDMAENARRLVTSGSLISTRRHKAGVTTTISGGVEVNEFQDLDLTDQTIQAALEIRYEAIPGVFLVTPFVSWLDRDWDTLERREEHLATRLQLTWVRVPHLGENALSVEGRFDRINLKSPAPDDSNEWGVQVSFGQRIGILR